MPNPFERRVRLFLFPMENTNPKKIEIFYIKASELKLSEYNPRKATPKQYDDLVNSIKKFGVTTPIIANAAPNRKNIVIGGHLRLQIAKDINIYDVPVVYVNLPNIRDEQELNLRLNNNTGSNDLDLLVNLDKDLLKEVGFDDDFLENAFEINLDIPSLEDIVFEEAYEPEWAVIRYDVRKREIVLKAIEALENKEGIRVELAKER